MVFIYKLITILLLLVTAANSLPTLKKKNLELPHALKQTYGHKNNNGNEFQVFQSNTDTDYSIRIKKIDPSILGVDTVQQWSGYLDYKDTKHFFYWFFESRNDPKNDPVILWLNGGPGCSSFTGLFFELGPSSISANLTPVYNPFSWNNNASVIFLEQPVGVGFSYSDDEQVTSTAVAGKDVYNFLELFFNQFPHLRSNKFHIAGESYAGHYIPQIAHEIAIEHSSDASFKLSSIMIGNGITDPLVQYKYYQPMACGKGGYPQVLTDEDCAKMESEIPRCELLNKGCYLSKTSFACIGANMYCENSVIGPYEKTGLNVYDIRAPCETDDGNCYIGQTYIEQYMNLKEVQEALGSDVDSYKGCSDAVFLGFALTGDGNKPFQEYVAELVDRNIPVLIYAGDKDYICNWLGNLGWVDHLDWTGKELFETLPLRPWYKDGVQYGQFKSLGSFNFLRVYDAGHMVPYDQPEASLAMVNSWISGSFS
ncbi:probable Putative serine carboxypeptidase YBR139W [Saccharomycodes ludwigii]|uniref:Carboxypeptidase n=1 Tax=Saccharomycodes ludwigii TaxID=36035 RepID=A0A376B4Z1_9ASCO|nr:hypothetical protein SCDLUD_002512 [Saccharomycodes ludwigii]KAH3901038.1 hypothetical protein SCDLUD_002512 [Saccharomycodes ludwigii]SSD59723.1 probable Putative serine carboxypeptidase YBR139W [Saccharomycodes ludwigii]